FQPPLGSGPYRITQVEPGRRLVFERVENGWGADLPVNVGKYDGDRAEVDLYRDHHVESEAFKDGELHMLRGNRAKNWHTGHNVPAVLRADVIRAEIPHRIPTQTQALFMNSRRDVFADRRVRAAMGLMLDFEWSNRTLFNGAYRRSESYFPNSEFSATGKPEGAERELLDRK